MCDNFYMVGEVYGNIKVIEPTIGNNFICVCVNCGNTRILSESVITSNRVKSCDACKSYKLDLETSKDIYDRYTLDNVSTSVLCKEYNCTEPTVLNAIKRIERLNDIEDS